MRIPHTTTVESPVIDTHLHCFAGNKDPRFPYHPRGPYQPADVATPEMLLQCMAGAGVNYAIVVHPEPYQDDHRYLEYCLGVGKGRLKGVCLVFADQPNSMRQLPALAKRGDIVAVRMHAYAPDRLPPFGKPEMRVFWRQAAELGLMVQLHLEPHYAAHFTPLIREFSQTKVIIDHLGRPLQGTAEEHATVVNWAKLPNVIMKFAAIPTATEYPYRDVRPVIRQLSDAYGADRLIYGGGFGPKATPESYRAARETIRGYLAHLNAADQAKVFGLNARKLFGFSA
ncbi:MAG: amidohydrolase [Acidobacteria bacterium]|nr:amidohydrolase [Acidobacteriota bacterium]MBI3425280.1 amidohydrolase [Acidobacteriota bacterium]